MKKPIALLLVLFLLALPMVVFAAEPGGALNGVIDGFTPRFITDPISRNAGALEGWLDIAGHPSLGGGMGISYRRTHDGQGIPIAAGWDTYAGNAVTLTFGTLLIRGPSDTPAGPGCVTDGERAMGANVADFGQPSSWSWERQLIMKGSDPGTYQATWTKGGYSTGTIAPPFVISRQYNPFPSTYHCLVKIRDSVTGGTIPGASMSIFRPYTDGPYIMDAVGGAQIDLAAQVYLLNITATGYKALSNHPMRIADRPDRDDLPHWDITLIPNSSPATYLNSGTLRMTVNDAVDKTHLTYAANQARVNINGYWHNCDENGEVYIDNLITGQVYTVAAAASGHVAQTQNISAGVSGNYVFELTRSTDDTGGGGDGDDPPAGTNVLDAAWWTDLFTDLFVPQQATIEAYETFIGTVRNWGPFGFMAGVFAAFDTGTRAGEQELCWEMVFDPFGGAVPPWQGCLDLRPLLAPGDPDYPAPHAGRGSITGTYVATFRVISGLFVWVLFAFMLGKKLLPRFTV